MIRARISSIRGGVAAGKHDGINNMEKISCSKDKIPINEADVSIASLISECEDYVKTEEFTKELSDKILQMFIEERAKIEKGDDVHNAAEGESSQMKKAGTGNDMIKGGVNNSSSSNRISSNRNSSNCRNTKYHNNLDKHIYEKVN